MGKVKAHELRGQKPEELLSQVDAFRTELAQLRVAKISGQGGPNKLSKIKVVRKSIARVLTVYNQSRMDALRKSYKKAAFKPLELRAKKTRAMRRQMTKTQKTKMTVAQAKVAANFPKRRYALRA